jgi:hypothetical protein
MKNNIEKLGKMENNIKEDVRETLAKLARDSECKMDQRIESVNDEVNVISEPTHGHVQIPTDTVKCNESDNFETQITPQLNSCDSEENVIEPGTLEIQAHATIDQGFVVSQEKCTLSGNSSDSNPYTPSSFNKSLQ